MAKQFKNNIKILFVCHGNICRSPMAEFFFKDLVNKRGISEFFILSSAATSREEIGNSVHRGTREKLAEAGISCSGKTARQMTRADYEKFDYLIGMDDWNIRNMNQIAGGDPDHKIFKLLHFTGSDRDVADPWYTGDFNAAWEDVTRGCTAFLEHLSEKIQGI